MAPPPPHHRLFYRCLTFAPPLPAATQEAELAWMASIEEWSADPCAALASPAYAETTQRVLDVMIDMEARDEWERDSSLHPAFEPALRSSPALFSHMRYEYEDGSVVRVALEPLIGPLRDPRPICLGTHSGTWAPALSGPPPLQLNSAMNWVVLDPQLKSIAAVGAPKAHPQAPRMPAYKRALLFDMGGMRWNREGSAWLHRQLSRMGVQLEHIYIWEATPISGQDYFGAASLDVRGGGGEREGLFCSQPLHSAPVSHLPPPPTLYPLAGPQPRALF